MLHVIWHIHTFLHFWTRLGSLRSPKVVRRSSLLASFSVFLYWTMASLLSLPDELLSTIIKYANATQRPKTRYAPTRGRLLDTLFACRRLHQVSLPFLYARIHIRLEGTDGLGKHDCLALLLRTVSENKGLSTLVRRLCITWTDYDAIRSDPLKTLLSCLPALKVLAVRQWNNPEDWSSIPIGFSSTFLEQESLQNLAELHVIDYSYTSKDLLVYLSLPRSKKLEINDTILGTSLVVPDYLAQRRCTVEQLKLTSFASEDLSTLLRLTPRLKDLTCYAPDAGRSSGVWNWSDPDLLDDARRKPLSPGGMTDILKPVIDGLESLNLSIMQDSWVVHDGSRLDLGSSEVLKTVMVEAYLFFNNDTVYESRMGLWKLLPKSIESLQVSSLFISHCETLTYDTRIILTTLF